MPLNSAMAMKRPPAGAERGGKLGARGRLPQRARGLAHESVRTTVTGGIPRPGCAQLAAERLVRPHIWRENTDRECRDQYTLSYTNYWGRFEALSKCRQWPQPGLTNQGGGPNPGDGRHS